MQKSKRYTITINGRVQEVGFRGYLEDVCNRLRIPSIVYNATINEIKLLRETDPKTLKELSSHIKRYKIAQIKGVRIDEGVKILYSIKSDTQKLDKLEKLDKLDKMDVKLDGIAQTLTKLDKLDEITETLKEISGKL